MRIAGTHLGNSNATVYSLQLLSTNERFASFLRHNLHYLLSSSTYSELTQQAAVLITVVSSAEDKASIILAIQEDFHTYLEVQVEVLRYGMCDYELQIYCCEGGIFLLQMAALQKTHMKQWSFLIPLRKLCTPGLKLRLMKLLHFLVPAMNY